MMPVAQMTDQQKNLIQDTLDEKMPGLNLSVCDHSNPENNDESVIRSVCVIGTKVVASLGLGHADKPEDEEKLLRLRAHDAALSVWGEMIHVVAKNLGRGLDSLGGRGSDAYSFLLNSRAMRDQVRQLIDSGEASEVLNDLDARQSARGDG
jgi:hypothetical protein